MNNFFQIRHELFGFGFETILVRFSIGFAGYDYCRNNENLALNSFVYLFIYLLEEMDKFPVYGKNKEIGKFLSEVKKISCFWEK